MPSVHEDTFQPFGSLLRNAKRVNFEPTVKRLASLRSAAQLSICTPEQRVFAQRSGILCQRLRSTQTILDHSDLAFSHSEIGTATMFKLLSFGLTISLDGVYISFYVIPFTDVRNFFDWSCPSISFNGAKL